MILLTGYSPSSFIFSTSTNHISTLFLIPQNDTPHSIHKDDTVCGVNIKKVFWLMFVHLLDQQSERGVRREWWSGGRTAVPWRRSPRPGHAAATATWVRPRRMRAPDAACLKQQHTSHHKHQTINLTLLGSYSTLSPQAPHKGLTQTRILCVIYFFLHILIL